MSRCPECGGHKFRFWYKCPEWQCLECFYTADKKEFMKEARMSLDKLMTLTWKKEREILERWYEYWDLRWGYFMKLMDKKIDSWSKRNEKRR